VSHGFDTGYCLTVHDAFMMEPSHCNSVIANATILAGLQKELHAMVSAGHLALAVPAYRGLPSAIDVWCQSARRGPVLVQGMHLAFEVRHSIRVPLAAYLSSAREDGALNLTLDGAPTPFRMYDPVETNQPVGGSQAIGPAGSTATSSNEGSVLLWIFVVVVAGVCCVLCGWAMLVLCWCRTKKDANEFCHLEEDTVAASSASPGGASKRSLNKDMTEYPSRSGSKSSRSSRGSSTGDVDKSMQEAHRRMDTISRGGGFHLQIEVIEENGT